MILKFLPLPSPLPPPPPLLLLILPFYGAMHRTICVSRQPQLRTKGFIEAKFYCPHDLAC